MVLSVEVRSLDEYYGLSIGASHRMSLPSPPAPTPRSGSVDGGGDESQRQYIACRLFQMAKVSALETATERNGFYAFCGPNEVLNDPGFALTRPEQRKRAHADGA